MDYITDMHTHILYGVDDGARSLKDSIRLIMVERRQGVKRIFPDTALWTKIRISGP